MRVRKVRMLAYTTSICLSISFKAEGGNHLSTLAVNPIDVDNLLNLKSIAIVCSLNNMDPVNWRL